MMGMEWLRPAAFFGSILYALIGVLVFWISFIVIDKLTPYDLSIARIMFRHKDETPRAAPRWKSETTRWPAENPAIRQAMEKAKAGGTAFHLLGRNDVLGIGKPVGGVGTAVFGSPARLKGWIDMADVSQYRRKPFSLTPGDLGFVQTLNVLAHEMGNFGSFPDIRKGKGGGKGSDGEKKTTAVMNE